MIRVLITIIIFTNTLFAQKTVLDEFLNIFKNIKRPDINLIKVTQQDGKIVFFIDSLEGLIVTDIKENAKVIFKLNDKNVFEKEISYTIWGHYFKEIVSFDYDQNGFDDIFIINFPLGASGYAANILQIAVFLIFDDLNFKYFELSSFLGGDELFADFNNDGRYEYSCFKLILTDNNKYYVSNLFSFDGVDFKNISKESVDFPIVFAQNDDMKIITDLCPVNDIIKYFPYPNVLIR